MFRQKWHYKKKQIIKSEIVELNPKIVRSPMVFKRYFPQLIELTDLGEFLNQGQDQSEYQDMKLGGVFTLQSPQIEFMLKIIIRPNLTGVFKVIPFQKYQSQGEQVLQNLVFIFG